MPKAVFCVPCSSYATLLQHMGLNRIFSTGPTVRRMALSAILFCLPIALQAEEASIRGPDVLIISGEDKVVYEFRQNGELRMVRVVPKWGKAYYLVPRDNTKGFGNLERADMLLPQWVIAEF